MTGFDAVHNQAPKKKKKHFPTDKGCLNTDMSLPLEYFTYYEQSMTTIIFHSSYDLKLFLLSFDI